MHSALLPIHEKYLPREQPDHLVLPREAKRRFDRALTLMRIRGRKFAPLRILGAVVAFLFLLNMFYRSGDQLETGKSLSSSISLSEKNSFYDFSKQTCSSNEAAEKREHVLICIPLRNSADVMDLLFDHLHNLTYPHSLIDLAFLISDSTDNTEGKLLANAIEATKKWSKQDQFASLDIFSRDLGAKIGQDVSQRHGVFVQAERRKLMGRARNWLLTVALKPHHSWVYWRDADIEVAPKTILEDLMRFDKDVIVPNVWRPLPKWLGGEQPYDLNSWVESPPALELASSLPEDDVIVEGYAEYPTWRVHLAYLRNENENPDDILELDGIGGVSILSKAHVFRAGAMFPGFAFENHAETEGFGKLCRRMGFSVAGLTQYTVWHKYEPSTDDIEQMKERVANGLSID